MGNGVRLGSKALGLACVAMLCLTAFGAAEAAALWLVESQLIATNYVIKASTHTEFNLKVEKETNLEILCSESSAEDLLLIAAVTEATGKINFTNCRTWQNGKEITANCKPVEPIVVSGRGFPLLHSSKNYVLFRPEVLNGTLATIKFKETCGLPASNNVKGSLVGECAELSEGLVVGVDCAKESKVHLLRPNEALFAEADSLLYGTKQAKLSGVLSVELQLGKPWCGHV